MIGEIKMNHYKRVIIWILIPLIYGYLANIFMIMIPPLLSQIIFGLFWFWVGKRFAQLHGSAIKNFLIGNSIWLLSLLIYIWQFFLVNDESRNDLLAFVSQPYALSFLMSGRELALLFTKELDVRLVTIISYLFMLLVFSVGFSRERNRIRLEPIQKLGISEIPFGEKLFNHFKVSKVSMKNKIIIGACIILFICILSLSPYNLFHYFNAENRVMYTMADPGIRMELFGESSEITDIKYLGSNMYYVKTEEDDYVLEIKGRKSSRIVIVFKYNHSVQHMR